jgi:hypothetical protein
MTEFLTYGGVVGTVSTAHDAGSATSFRCSDVTEATASHYVGKRVWVMTGTCAGQYWGVVTAYSLSANTEGIFTCSPGSPTSEVLANAVTVAVY